MKLYFVCLIISIASLSVSVIGQDGSAALKLEDIFQIPQTDSSASADNSEENIESNHYLEEAQLAAFQSQSSVFLPMDLGHFRDTTLKASNPEFERQIDAALSVIDKESVDKMKSFDNSRILRSQKFAITELDNSAAKSSNASQTTLQIVNEWKQVYSSIEIQNIEDANNNLKLYLTPGLSDQIEIEPGEYDVTLEFWTKDQGQRPVQIQYETMNFEDQSSYVLDLPMNGEDEIRSMVRDRTRRDSVILSN